MMGNHSGCERVDWSSCKHRRLINPPPSLQGAGPVLPPAGFMVQTMMWVKGEHLYMPKDVVLLALLVGWFKPLGFLEHAQGPMGLVHAGGCARVCMINVMQRHHEWILTLGIFLSLSLFLPISLPILSPLCRHDTGGEPHTR